MGPYCNFCNNRCFTRFPEGTPDYILKAYGTNTIIAICKQGQELERQKIGYCYDQIVKIISETQVNDLLTARQHEIEGVFANEFFHPLYNATELLKEYAEIISALEP